MHATHTPRKLLLLVFTALMIALAPIGQAKPPPEAIDGSRPAPTTGGKPKPAPLDDTPKGPDVDGFAKAYGAANDPPILVLVGRDTRTLQKPGRTATGGRSDVADNVIGGSLNLIDTEGNALKLHGDIEQIMLEIDDVEVDLISLDALAEADRRAVRLLQQQGEQQAVDLLASKLNAEVVLLVKLIETPAVKQKNARYRVLVETIDVPRGRKIGGFTFDWLEGTDSRSIKAYATAITRKFMEQFVRAKSRGGVDGIASRKYTVNFVGLEQAAQLKIARDALQGVDGVSKVRTRGMSKAGGTSIATLEVTYAGDPLDLVFDAQDGMADTLGMAADAGDIQAGTITFMAKALVPQRPKPQPVVQLNVVGLSSADAAVAIREQLKAVDGMSGLVDQGLSVPAGGKRSVASWGGQYEGQALDLTQQASAIVSAATGEMVSSDVRYDARTSTTTLTLTLTGPMPRWLMLMSEDTAAGRAARASFKEDYKQAAAPTIGLMVNRVVAEVVGTADPTLEQEAIRLLREDPDNPNLPALLAKLNGGAQSAVPGAEVAGNGLAQSAGTAGEGDGDGVVVAINLVSGDVNNNTQNSNNTAQPGVTPAGGTLPGDAFNLQLNNTLVENAIYKNLIKLGLTMKDPDAVRKTIAAQAQDAKNAIKEEDLLSLLIKEGGMDIVILGHGRLIEGKRGALGQDPPSIVYTFRAVRVKDGVTVAADSYAQDLSFTQGHTEADAFVVAAAKYFAGNIADQMWAQW